jgi:hypothetical protein
MCQMNVVAAHRQGIRVEQRRTMALNTSTEKKTIAFPGLSTAHPDGRLDSLIYREWAQTCS